MEEGLACDENLPARRNSLDSVDDDPLSRAERHALGEEVRNIRDVEEYASAVANTVGRRASGDTRDPRVAARSLSREHNSASNGRTDDAILSERSCSDGTLQRELDSGDENADIRLDDPPHSEHAFKLQENSVHQEGFSGSMKTAACGAEDRSRLNGEQQRVSRQYMREHEDEDLHPKSRALTSRLQSDVVDGRSKIGAEERKRPRSESPSSSMTHRITVQEGNNVNDKSSIDCSVRQDRFWSAAEPKGGNSRRGSGSSAHLAAPDGAAESKRPRQTCYRCGGMSHIASLCPSERDSIDNPDAIVCDGCEGRGHTRAVCPTVVGGGNPCYLCRQPGHFARECPNGPPRGHGFGGYGNSDSVYRQHHEYGGHEYTNSNYSNGPMHGYGRRTGGSGDGRANGNFGIGSDFASYGANGIYEAGAGRRGGLHGGDRFTPGRGGGGYVTSRGGGGGGYGWNNGYGGGNSYGNNDYGSSDGAFGGPVRYRGGGGGVVSGFGSYGNRGRYGGNFNGGYGGDYGRDSAGNFGGGNFGGGSLYRDGAGSYTDITAEYANAFRPMKTSPAMPGTGRCFRCNAQGHWTRDCPQKPADADPNGCYKCGRLGHRSRECNACYKCFEEGHRAVDCPQQESE